MTLKDWGLIIACAAMIGCAFMFNAVLLRELGPITVGAGRVTIAAIACWLLVLAMRRPLPRDPVVIVKLLLLGVLSYIPFVLYPFAQASLASGVTAVINSLTPILTVLIAQLFFSFNYGGEKATPLKLLGVVVGFAGAAILSMPALSRGGSTELWAVVLCLCAATANGLSGNVTRRFLGIDFFVIGAVSLTGASLVDVPLALVIEGMPQIARPETWFSWVAIGLVSTAGAMLVSFRILKSAGAVNASLVTFIAPALAVVLGIVILGESLLPIQLLGMLVIFCGLLLLDGRVVRRFRRAAA